MGITAGGGGLDLFADTTCADFSAPVIAAAQRPDPPQRAGTSPLVLARWALARAISLAPQPELRVSPNRAGLTGLRSFFWLAEPPRPITATASVPGISVTARATPIRYLWDFGEATKATAHSGRPWTRRRPGNVGHRYERRGRYDVGVQVVYSASWSSGAGWEPLGYFTTSTRRTYPVRQVVAALKRSRR